MVEVEIANGCAVAPEGDWLMGRAQPVACLGTAAVSGLRGFIVPDRAVLRQVRTTGTSWCAAQDRPFLTRLDALPDESLTLVSEKLLVAPFASRTGARSVKLLPLSFRRATAVTALRFGWAVVATRSRVTRVALEADRTLTVRPEAVVAWLGKDPTGFCPRLSLTDILLPRGPKNLAYTFHGPATVWFEGGKEAERLVRRRA